MTAVESGGPTVGWRFDGERGPVTFDPAAEAPGGGVRWLSFDGAAASPLEWLQQHGFADASAASLAPADDPRPALLRSGGRIAVSLRTAATGKAAAGAPVEPVLILAEPGLVVTVRRGPVAALEALEADPAAAGRVADAGALLAVLVERCVDGLEPVVDGITEQMDLLEERLIGRTEDSLVPVLGQHRRTALHVHRRVAPQREVLHRLAAEAPEWMDDRARALIARAAEACGRMLEDIQAARDHAALVQDEMAAQQNERLNRRLYLFTIIASIFLPLTFFTGLLGANVEGIPYATAAWAFAVVAALCVLIATVQFLVLRWFRLL